MAPNLTPSPSLSRALIQHEDFQSKYAVTLLKRYRKEYLMFNDDIQGE